MTDFMKLHKPGLGNTNSYQVSAIPWVSSSIVVPATGNQPIEINFPYVTRGIIVKHTAFTATNLKVGFSAAGVSSGTNYFSLSSGESLSAEWKVTRIFLLADAATQVTASVVVGLTHIPASELPNSWSGSVGVG